MSAVGEACQRRATVKHVLTDCRKLACRNRAKCGTTFKYLLAYNSQFADVDACKCRTSCKRSVECRSNTLGVFDCAKCGTVLKRAGTDCNGAVKLVVRIVFTVDELAEFDGCKFGKSLKRVSSDNVTLSVDFHIFQVDTALECVFGDLRQGGGKNNSLHRGVVFEAVLVEVHYVFVARNYALLTAVVVVQGVVGYLVVVANHHFYVLGRQRCAVCGNSDECSAFFMRSDQTVLVNACNVGVVRLEYKRRAVHVPRIQ